MEKIDSDQLTNDFRRQAFLPTSMSAGMATRRRSLFSMMYLNANPTAAYFGVPAAQVVEIGLEIEI